jgi:hypothetical protein
LKKQTDIEEDPGWCPNCLYSAGGDSSPSGPSGVWHLTVAGLTCSNCYKVLDQSKLERYRERIKKQRRELGSGFEAWMSLIYRLDLLDHKLENFFRSLGGIANKAEKWEPPRD